MRILQQVSRLECIVSNNAQLCINTTDRLITYYQRRLGVLKHSNIFLNTQRITKNAKVHHTQHLQTS